MLCVKVSLSLSPSLHRECRVTDHTSEEAEALEFKYLVIVFTAGKQSTLNKSKHGAQRWSDSLSAARAERGAESKSEHARR